MGTACSQCKDGSDPQLLDVSANSNKIQCETSRLPEFSQELHGKRNIVTLKYVYIIYFTYLLKCHRF